VLGEHCCFFLLCSHIGVTASIVAAWMVCVIVVAGRYGEIVVVLALLVTVTSDAPYVSNGLFTQESDSTLGVTALHQTSVSPV